MKQKAIVRKKINKKEYTPQRLAEELWSRASKKEFEEEATIYLFTKQAFKDTVAVEWQDPSYSKDRKKKYEEVKKILTRSRMFTTAKEIGRQNILNNLSKWDMLDTLEEYAGEVIDGSRIHAIDSYSWVYWTLDGKPIIITFMTGGGYMSRPEFREATSSELRYFAERGYNA